MNENGKKLAVWGTVLQLGFLIGLAGTVTGMIRAFAESANNGETRPEVLIKHMGLALCTAAGGVIVSLLGVVLLFIALFHIKYRSSWFKTAMWIIAVLWLLSIPVGTILGIVVMLYLSKHGDEFTEQAAARNALMRVRAP